MNEPAIGFFLVMLFVVPLVYVAIWRSCIPTLDAIEEAIKKIEDANRAMDEAWGKHDKGSC